MSSLPEGFSSDPKAKRFVLYIEGKREAVHIFTAVYAAKKFLDVILRGESEDDWEVVDVAPVKGMRAVPTLRTDWGIEIRCDELREIMEHEYSTRELAWDLPHPYDKYALLFRRNAPAPREESAVTSLAPRSDAKTSSRSRSTEKRERTPGAARRNAGNGLVSITQIAEELNMRPRDARAALRKAKVMKPAGGWAWKQDEVEGVKERLRAVSR
jgi:hypothetical protein